MLEFAIGLLVVISLLVILFILGLAVHFRETKSLSDIDFVECLENGVKVILALGGIIIITLIMYVIGTNVLILFK